MKLLFFKAILVYQMGLCLILLDSWLLYIYYRNVTRLIRTAHVQLAFTLKARRLEEMEVVGDTGAILRIYQSMEHSVEEITRITQNNITYITE